jgi:hypothetical protein
VVSGRAAKPLPALVCALYSEDRADASRSFGTLEQIVRGMLRLVEEHAKTNHIDFKPVARDIPGTYWKVTSKSTDVGAQQKRRDLLRAVATELRLGCVMFFHVDGDRPWAEREQAPVRGDLERFRRDLRSVAAHAQLGSLDESMLDDVFIAVVPFYSIESWIYACTEQLCTRTSDAKELELIAEWAAELGKLDEVRYIKDANDALPSIKDQCNHELARHIPAAKLYAAGKSYTDTVERVRKSSRIQAGLAETLQRDW